MLENYRCCSTQPDPSPASPGTSGASLICRWSCLSQYWGQCQTVKSAPGGIFCLPKRSLWMRDLYLWEPMDGHGAVSSGTYNWKAYCVRQNSEVVLNISAPLLYVPCLIIFPLVCTEPVNIRDVIPMMRLWISWIWVNKKGNYLDRDDLIKLALKVLGLFLRVWSMWMWEGLKWAMAQGLKSSL